MKTDGQNKETQENQKRSTVYQQLRNIKAWFKRTMRIQDDTDIDATITSIGNSIVFKGINVWILFFAIIVASIGLNVNSTAVIIGAMLISPLMGPINGIGLAIGTTDQELLRKSLMNLVIMVIVSLVASTTYFLLSPLGDAQSELLARTRPTIFDVLIAFFGGMAGIVATSRKSQPFTVISGVAIATALMPPLCTAGYGLATGQFRYFFGAFYLFFINSFFIALATFLLVRYLHFPQKSYLNKKNAQLVKRSITIFAIIVIIPSVITALDVIRESSFNASANRFINEIQESTFFEHAQLINAKKEFTYKKQTITLSVVGEKLSEGEIAKLQTIMHTQYGLSRTNLIVKQTNTFYDPANNESELIETIWDKKEAQLIEREERITQLEKELSHINGNKETAEQIAKEMAIQYPDITSFAVTKLIYTETQTLKSDTIPSLFIRTRNVMSEEQKQKLIQWLRVRFNEPKLEIHN